MLGCRTATRPFTVVTRLLHSSSRRFSEPFNPAAIERAEDEVDVCIVGGGPAGISAAIRLKQLEREKGNEIRVVVLEKGSEVGQLLSRSPERLSTFSSRLAHRLWCCN